MDVVENVVTAVALTMAAWSALLVLLNRPVLASALSLRVTLVLLAMLELVLLAQVVAGVTVMVDAEHDFAQLVYACYLVGPVLLLPLAAAWAAAERTRWGAAVLVVACLVIPVLTVRLDQILAGR